MKRRIITSLAVVLVILVSAQSWSLAEKSTAAVMPLEKGAGGAEYDGLGRALADMMVTDLGRSDVLQLVERSQLKLILDELKLGQSKYLNKKTAQKLGRGLGARYIVTGSFSVTNDTFVIDCRIFEVATGAVLKTARSKGPISDFVAVEKDVVEKLLDGLKIKLSLVDRRKLLIDSPTEDAEAAASFGRGMNAIESGKLAAAQKAFKAAVTKDPNFSRAGEALGSLANSVEAAVDKESDRERRLRGKPLFAALKQLPSEMKRKNNFVDTIDSLIDFTLRQHLLRNTEQHCQRYRELKHYFFRRKGQFAHGIAGFIPDAKSRLRVQTNTARRLVRARQMVLGVTADTLFKATRATRFVDSAMVLTATGTGLLFSNGLYPERRDGLFSAMQLCHTPTARVKEFEAFMRATRKWKWLDQPISKENKISVRDGLALYGAYLRARFLGVNSALQGTITAVLSKYPEGHESRRSMLTRVESVVKAGKAYEMSILLRSGLSEREIVSAARVLQTMKSKSIYLTPLCKDFGARTVKKIQHSYNRYQQAMGKRVLQYLPDALDSMASGMAPMIYAGCFRTSKRRPLALSEIAAYIKRAAIRVNPANDKNENCPNMVKGLSIWATQIGSEMRAGYRNLGLLQQAFRMRCLIPQQRY